VSVPIRLALLLGTTLWTGTGAAATAPLGDVLEQLQDAGYPVLYALDLVTPDTPIETPVTTPEQLAGAIRPLGLSLQRVGGQWVINRLAPQPEQTQIVVRSARGQPLEQTEVRWSGGSARLDPDAGGRVMVPAPPGALVTFSAPRHRSRTLRLADAQTVVLEPSPLVEKVIVTGSRHRLAERNVTGSITTLEADDLANAPTLGGDALRTVVQLPGISSVGVSAKPRIRGGLADELLVRLDGVELLDAYHLADFQSVFSAVDDRAVSAVDVYTGGFPARYGNRLSGVIDIYTGDVRGPPRSEFGLSLFSVFANTRGALGNGDTRYLASARRGNLDQITRAVNPDLGTPRYYDALTRVDRDLDPDTTITVGGFVTRDDVTLEEDETRARSHIDSRYLWLRLQQRHGERLTSASTMTYTHSDRSKRLQDFDDDSGRAGFLDHEQSLRKIAVRSDFSWQGQETLMEFGGELEHGWSDYRSLALIDRGPIGALLTGQAVSVHDIDLDPDGLAGGAYWAAELEIGENLTLQPGIRWDFQDFDPDGTTYHVSPRLGLRWQAADTLSVHLDVGRFHQPEALHELQAADGETGFFRPQSADHFILGVDWLRGEWEWRAELYEKLYRRIKRRHENVFNPFVLVPELEPDRVAIDPDRARARGLDLTARRQLSEQAFLRVHYGYMDAEDRIAGDWVPRRWSQQHSAGFLVSWEGRALSASLGLSWHSGWRGASLPPAVPAGTVLPLQDVLNSSTLRDYLSLDASLRRTWQLGRSTLTAFASVTNLTNRANLAGLEYDAELDDGLVTFETERETLLPLVPSIGVLISF
jgi:outer membrane cobalamin receptor